MNSFSFWSSTTGKFPFNVRFQERVNSRLFKSFEFGNGSRISDIQLSYLNLNIARIKNGRNKLYKVLDTAVHSCYGWKWHFLAKKHYAM